MVSQEFKRKNPPLAAHHMVCCLLAMVFIDCHMCFVGFQESVVRWSRWKLENALRVKEGVLSALAEWTRISDRLGDQCPDVLFVNAEELPPPLLYAEAFSDGHKEEWVRTLCACEHPEFRKEFEHKGERAVCVCEYIGQEENLQASMKLLEEEVGIDVKAVHPWRHVGVWFTSKIKDETGCYPLIKIMLNMNTWVESWYKAFDNNPENVAFMQKHCMLELFLEGNKGVEQLRGVAVRFDNHMKRKGGTSPCFVEYGCHFCSSKNVTTTNGTGNTRGDDEHSLQNPWRAGAITSVQVKASIPGDMSCGNVFYFDKKSGVVRIAQHYECDGICMKERCLYSPLGEYRQWEGYTEDSRLNTMLGAVIKHHNYRNVFFHSTVVFDGEVGCERIVRQSINTKSCRCMIQSQGDKSVVVDTDLSEFLPEEYQNEFTRHFEGDHGEERMVRCDAKPCHDVTAGLQHVLHGDKPMAHIFYNGPRFHETRMSFAFGTHSLKTTFTLRPHAKGQPATITRVLNDYKLGGALQQDPNCKAWDGGTLEIVYFVEPTICFKSKSVAPDIFLQCNGVTYTMHPNPKQGSSSPPGSMLRGAMFFKGPVFNERIVKSAFYVDSECDQHNIDPVLEDDSALPSNFDQQEDTSFEQVWYAIHGPRIHRSLVKLEANYKGKRGREMRSPDNVTGHALPIPQEFHSMYNHLWDMVKDDTSGDGISKPMCWQIPTPECETTAARDAGRDPVLELEGDVLTRKHSIATTNEKPQKPSEGVCHAEVVEVPDAEVSDAEDNEWIVELEVLDKFLKESDADRNEASVDSAGAATHKHMTSTAFSGFYESLDLCSSLFLCCCWTEAPGVFVEKTEFLLMQKALGVYRETEITSGQYIDKLEATQAVLKETLRRVQTERSEIEAKCIALDAAVVRYKDSVAREKEISTTLKKTALLWEEKFNNKNVECLKLEAEVSCSEKQRKLAEDTIAKITSEVNVIEKETKAERDKHAMQIKATENAKRAQAGSDRKCSKLEAELAELREQLHGVAVKCQNLKEENEALHESNLHICETEERTHLAQEEERRKLNTELDFTRNMYATEVQRGQDREAELQQLKTLLRQYSPEHMHECDDDELQHLLDKTNQTVCDIQDEIQRRAEQRMQLEHQKRIAEMQAEHERQMAEAERLHKMRVAEAQHAASTARAQIELGIGDMHGFSSASCGSMSDSDSECRMSALSSPSPIRSCSPSVEGTRRPECAFCMEASVEMLLMPCRHICLCEHCALVEMKIPKEPSSPQQKKKQKRKKKEVKEEAVEMPKCPICSGPVQNAQRIFLA